jgi:alpha-L-rhamnosidase
MYRVAAGINPAEPGYRRVLFAPRPGGSLTNVRAAHDSVRGRIASEWRIDGGRFKLQVDVPANTRATVRMPVSGDEHEAGPGTHAFEADWK